MKELKEIFVLILLSFCVVYRLEIVALVKKRAPVIRMIKHTLMIGIILYHSDMNVNNGFAVTTPEIPKDKIIVIMKDHAL